MLVILLAACSGGNNEENVANSPGVSSTPTNEESANDNEGSDEADVYENGLPKDEEVTIRVGFREQGYGREWYDFAVDKFTERFPNVTFDTTYTPNLGTILTPLVAAGNDDDMYDLFYPSFEGGDTFRELNEQGRFEPMDDMWERELYDEPGVTLRDVTSDNMYQVITTLHGQERTVNLPTSGGWTGGLFYDKALFAEKGWNESPRTLDEFVELMETIKADGIIPITYPGMHPDYLLNHTFDMYPFAVADSEGKFEEYEAHYKTNQLPVYLHEYWIDQYQLLYEFGQAGYFPQGVAAINHTQSQMQVLRHEAALVSSATWIGNEMADAAPEGFEWGFMGVPFTNNPDDPVYLRNSFGTANMVIWKEKPELVKAWAKEFLLFLYDFDVQMAMAQASITPPRLDFGDDPARREALDDVAREVAEYIVEHNAVQYDPRRDVAMTSPSYNQVRRTIYDATPGITTGDTDPMPVLEEAEGYFAQAWEEQEEQGQ